MKIGFIGAGKVGVSLGKYLTTNNVTVTGYYSKTLQSSIEAADFTNTTPYEKMSDLVEASDVLFLTVPDGVIKTVWEQLKMLPITNKIISHFSGSLSSTLSSEISQYDAFGYSIHPLYAINDKYQSYKELSTTYMIIEGHDKYLYDLSRLFERFGNKVVPIQAKDKIKYHASATMVSNLYVGLVSLGENMLIDCGFTQDEAHGALTPLIEGNTKNILSYGPSDALTGPIERNDLTTIANHLHVLNRQEKEVYKALSKQILKLAEEKHTDRNYEEIRGMIKE